MKQHLENYIDTIKKFPIKKKYTKDELLIPKLLVEKEGDIEIYYAPHNEYINPKAKIFIVGITPGFEQMSTAIAEARVCIEEDIPLQVMKYRCKVAGRFSGSLRHNLIALLNQLNLKDYLKIDDASQLFEEADDLLHTISAGINLLISSKSCLFESTSVTKKSPVEISAVAIPKLSPIYTILIK